MEPQQRLNQWLSSTALPRPEPEFAPLRYLGTVLQALWACEMHLREYDSEGTRERIKKLILAHIEDRDPAVRKARLERLRNACSKFGHVLKVIESD